MFTSKENIYYRKRDFGMYSKFMKPINYEMTGGSYLSRFPSEVEVSTARDSNIPSLW